MQSMLCSSINVNPRITIVSTGRKTRARHPGVMTSSASGPVPAKVKLLQRVALNQSLPFRPCSASSRAALRMPFRNLHRSSCLVASCRRRDISHRSNSFEVPHDHLRQLRPVALQSYPVRSKINELAAILHNNIVRHNLQYFRFPRKKTDAVSALSAMRIRYGISYLHGTSLNPVITSGVVRDAYAPHTRTLSPLYRHCFCDTLIRL